MPRRKPSPRAPAAPPEKPPYRVPSMEEIRAVPLNGLKVASTFSGCGGSCLGFKMAGFAHVYANEFVPAARETYAANFPGVRLDDRDIRLVQPKDVLRGTGLKVGQLDVLEGSPPCASFSTAGKRSKGWGEVKAYSDVRQRTDDLFFEFTRLLKGLKPRAFVAENVSGLIKGVAKGYFLQILSELKACGYVVECRVLDAQWLGVPQQRARTIFVGVREDLSVAPAFPAPLPYRYSIRDALPWIGGVEHDTSGTYSKGVLDVDVDVVPAVTVGVGGMNSLHFKVTDPAPKAGGKPNRFSSGFRGGEGLSGDDLIPTIMADGVGGSSRAQYHVHAPAPPGADVLVKTAKHRPGFNGTMGRGRRADEPSFAIPSEPRKFTIEELRRLGGFPDDFVLTGTYRQQWERIGRAVPPVMMAHVARALRDGVFGKLPRKG
jgi:DNA (cytosine-5)-methyltransferase 1